MTSNYHEVKPVKSKNNLRGANIEIIDKYSDECLHIDNL